MHVHVPECILCNWYRFQQQQKGPNPDLLHGQKTHNPLMQRWTFESIANTKNKIMSRPTYSIFSVRNIIMARFYLWSILRVNVNKYEKSSLHLRGKGEVVPPSVVEPGFRIRIDLMRIRMRIRIQHFF